MNQMLEILKTQNVLAGALRRMTGFVREGSYELYPTLRPAHIHTGGGT